MPVLLAVLKFLAVLLGIAVVLVAVALLLPLGFAMEYRPDRFRVSAVYGPFRRTVWSHRMHQPKQRKIVDVQKETTVSAPTPSAAKEENVPPEPPPEEEEEELPSGAMGRLERMILLLEENPKSLANCVLGHMRWLHRHSIFKISIRHADIFWTVTCEDAAKTAIAYGAEMAALNTALALVQQTVHLQSDRLWLEPDFTGARRSERKIACTMSASAILMLHLLYRIWRDPLLQPQTQPEPQKI